MRVLFPTLPSALIVLAAFALGACKKEPSTPAKQPEYVIADSTAGASEAEPQVVNGDTFEDYFSAFTLRRPNSDWQFLTQEKSRNINPDAEMTMMNPGKGAFMAMVVEQMEGTTLQSYSKLIASDTSPFSGAELEEKKIGRLDAIHFDAEAMASGVPFTYRVALIKRGDFFYQILGWAMSNRYAAAESDIADIIASFKPVRDREPALRANLDTPDADGAGWQIRDRVYANGPAGFRLSCPEGCRLMSATELAQINDAADAGVAGGFGEFYLQWATEHAPDADAIDQIGREIAALEGTAGEEREVQIGGRPGREVQVLGVEMDGGITLQYRAATVYVSGIAHRILAWWQPENSEAALAHLENCYASVEWLDASEREKLAEALNAADTGNAIGADFAMRRGTFYDFAHGFQLTLPDGQLFEVETVATVDPSEMEGSRVTLENLNDGAYCMVYAGTTEGYDSHAAYHASEVEAFDNALPTKSVKAARGAEFLVTHFSTETDGTVLSQVAATAAYGEGQVIEFWITIVGADRGADLDASLLALAAGLDTPSGGLESVTRAGRRTTDLRLGYQVESPGGWKMSHEVPTGLETLSSMVSLERKGAYVGYMAICSPMGLDLELASNAMVKATGFELKGNGAVDPGVSFAGQTGERRSVEGRLNGKRAQLYMWTAKRSHTGYLCYIIDQKRTISGEEADKIANRFVVLD